MPHCHECGSKLDPNSKFCMNCGTKSLNAAEPKQARPSPEAPHPKQIAIRKKPLIIAGIIIAALITLALAFFLVPVPYTAVEEYQVTTPFTVTETYLESKPYTATETYTETVPYTTTETYYDTEPYTDTKCTDTSLTKNIKWGQNQNYCSDTACASYSQVCVQTNWLGNCIEYQSVCQSTTCTQYTASCNIIVKNLDTTGGTFSFDGYYDTSDNQEHLVKHFSQYLQPSDEQSFTWTYTVDHYNELKQCRYTNFNNPTKTECDNIISTRQVQKTRTVTKYQDVDKTRDVTQFHDVELTRDVTKLRNDTLTRNTTKTSTLYDMATGQTQYYYQLS